MLETTQPGVNWSQQIPIVQLAGGLISFLLSLNIYFLKRLVNKIDRIESIEMQIHKNQAQYEENYKSLCIQIREISDQYRDVNDLKTEVAILRYSLERNDMEFRKQ